MTLRLIVLLVFVVGCGPAAPRASDPIAVGDPSDPMVSETPAAPDPGGPALPEVDRALDPQHDQVYELARLDRYLFLGTQGGASVIDVPSGRRVAAFDEFICNSVTVVHESVWTGCDKHVLRWSPATGWRAYLPNDENDANYYDVLVDPQGQLLVGYGADQWRYDPAADSFERTSVPIGDAYHAVYYRGELWTIDFMAGLYRQGTLIPISSATYPARDPRRFSVDSQDRLYVEDFGAGILRWNGQAFQPVPGLTTKGTGVAYDGARDRLWLLNYTDGLTVTIGDQVVQTIDLSDLGYMRRMLLEPDGSVWVAGWPGLVRIRWEGGEPIRETILDPG